MSKPRSAGRPGPQRLAASWLLRAGTSRAPVVDALPLPPAQLFCFPRPRDCSIFLCTIPTTGEPMNHHHSWKFFRAGGFDQVKLDSGADLMALDQLDQKLWVA